MRQIMIERIVKAAVDWRSGSGEGSGYEPREHGCGGECFVGGLFASFMDACRIIQWFGWRAHRNMDMPKKCGRGNPEQYAA